MQSAVLNADFASTTHASTRRLQRPTAAAVAAAGASAAAHRTATQHEPTTANKRPKTVLQARCSRSTSALEEELEAAKQRRQQAEDDALALMAREGTSIEVAHTAKAALTSEVAVMSKNLEPYFTGEAERFKVIVENIVKYAAQKVSNMGWLLAVVCRHDTCLSQCCMTGLWYARCISRECDLVLSDLTECVCDVELY